MKVELEGRLWPLPRPYIHRNWEERTMSLSLCFGNGFTDDICAIHFRHELTDRQLDLLDRFYVRPMERRRN